MDSINREQSEDNREDLQGGEAVERIRDVVKQSDTCFFCAKLLRDKGKIRALWEPVLKTWFTEGPDGKTLDDSIEGTLSP